jgi:hypothetical protein
MTSRDDAVRAAVAPLIADLRGDLLVMPDEQIVEQHLEMMTFEQKVLATPRFVQPRTRARMPYSRRALIAVVAAFATLVSCGLSAAGALPAPLQHITDSIAHTFGVPHADGAAAPAKASGHTAPSIPVEPPASGPAAPKPAAAPITTTTIHKATTKPAPTTSTTIALPPAESPIATTRPHVPPAQVTTDNPGQPPSNYSTNVPPGFPANWREQAASAASAQLVLICPQATTPTAPDCPQQASVTDMFTMQPMVWSILNQPLNGAVVVARTTPGNPARHIAPTTVVTVYEAFEMDATYVTNEGLTRYAYSSGIGAATMRWNGSAFVNVSFGPGSVAGHLLPGLKPPTLPHPSLDNAQVLGAVSTAFQGCAVPPQGTDPTPTCPQASAAGEQWTIPTDPSLGATVTYDPATGLYTVTGTYSMSSNLGNTAAGPYTATLFYDGVQPQVLSIDAG